MTSVRARLFAGAICAWVVAAGGLVPSALTSAAAEAAEAASCLVPIAPTTLLNTAQSGSVASGALRTVPLPSTLPGDLAVVVLQVRASGSKPGELTVSPASTPSARQSLLRVLSGKWQSTTAVVPMPGAQLTVTFTSTSRGANASMTIEAVAYAVGADCIHPLSGIPAVDSASGKGLSGPGPLQPGTDTPFSLTGDGLVPADAGSTTTSFRVSSGAYPATATILNDASPPVNVASWTLPANATWVGTQQLPPSSTSQYTIKVAGGPVHLTVSPLAWFTNSNAFASALATVIDTFAGVGAPKAILGAGKTLTASVPADVVNPAGLVVSLRATAKQDAVGYVWPSSEPQPVLPTFHFQKGATGYQEITLRSGRAMPASFSVRLSSGSMNLVARVVGWVPHPPAVNEPVSGVTHVVADADVTAPTVDPVSGGQTFTYNGDAPLDIGDVVVQGSTPDQPDGFLGIVTEVTTPAPTATISTLRHGDATQGVVAASTAETGDTVTLRPASLMDALPNADMDSAVLEVDSGDAGPDDSPPLGPDDPLSADLPSTEPEVTGEGVVADSMAKPVRYEGSPTRLAAMATSGGLLPRGGALSCSGGSVTVTSALKLYAGLNLSGSWRWRGDTTANFSAKAGLTGSLSLNANAGVSCSAFGSFPGPALPPITFTVGPVPVVVRPVLSLDVRATGSVGGSFKSTAAVDVGLDTGVNYRNGSFTPYFTPRANFPVTVDARLGGSLRVEAAPRLDLKVYGVHGPYFTVKAWARGDVKIAQTPWWTASAGLDAEVGLKLDLWFLHAHFTASRSLLSWQAGSAPGAFPGPVITSTSVPSGTVGAPYSATLQATGGATPYSWSIVGGGLPNGLRLSSNGVISGTPATSQSSSFTVRAMSATGYRSPTDKTLTLVVGVGPSILTTSLPDGTVGSGYHAALQASGGSAPYTWSLVGGSLPAGLGLASNGVISGTPATAQTATFTVRVVDSAGRSSPSNATYSVTIRSTSVPPPPPPGPVVWISKGASAVGQPGCSHSSCAWINVSVSGFSPNARLEIVCRDSTGPGGWWTFYKTTDGAGNGNWVGGSCYYGFPGQQFWVTANGVKSNVITW